MCFVYFLQGKLNQKQEIMDYIYQSTTSRSLQSTSTSSEFVSGACHLCSKIFKNVKLRNRHIKRIHKIDVSIKKIDHIVCPLCEQETSLQTHENLRKHIKENHQVSIELITLEFSSKQEYETWKDMQKIETSYATSRTVNAKEHKILYYECNRSDTYGYKPHSKIRTEKSGGSIRIKGVCPSRLICKLTNQGQVSVSYWKTHAGHKEELRAIHLSKAEEKTIEEKLMAGVPPSRILQDSRKFEKPQLDRLALLTSQDLANLSKKYNVHKKRDQNDMVATTLKVQEWNANNKNYAFLFKKEGEEHDVLRKEDFAIGFMNKIMEDKLRKFPKIICMDGTHGTNKRQMDLTIMLVKDDRNAGFPVAFLLSNRLDQQVQEVFLDALKNKMKTEIQAEHFMSDDENKYYNAWVKIMGNEPNRLLCTWHVVKNWNIQGKKKFHDPTLKKEMKTELRQIITETDVDTFNELCRNYLIKLQNANETEFFDYLREYYLKDLKRIKMWAHCYRRNSGINTNMAIESLNNLLKTNYLKRNGRVGIEKLLDTIDELVETKMWKRIVDMKRPNANNYQDRTIMKSHRGAERNKKKMKVTKNVAVYGQYQVTSLKDPSLLQNVTLSQVCESECKLLFCRVCKICMHRYQCDCTVYEVKNTLCQHVHLVRMYEESVGTNSVLDDAARCLGESSIIKSNHEEEINEFIREKLEQTNETQEKTKGSLELQNEIKNEMEALKNEMEALKNEMEDLDDTSLTKLRDELR
ncbi:uncharacterized protein LOC126882291 isoform X2 [Diabrotica virgifera virgifera]|uniref:C2H2-type domain-containing protein n=2 Tax=Diabrotica virgifera virgifera TaxID=50390 RepID=A0ABM5JYT9_DIAVI|nr:uncharacterized protein LOC126882291 isoform X1 [Diabrotica virgifera virgifera]XP_050503108.1 uncharacterized protein LOC126882291 isoform X2 [Diabrotica virgifera virgifera]